MSFIRKILDALKMESTREMEREEEICASERKEEQTSNAYDKDSEEKPIKNISKPKNKRMSQYDLERFAIECNSYMVREERKECREQEEKAREENKIKEV